MFDAVIIGAGPAGAGAAFDLAAAGARVLVADKREFPREKACAGGITPRALSLFRFDVSLFVRRQCQVLKIVPPKGRSFLVKASSPLCFMTRRKDLDEFALKRAMESGAEFRIVRKIQSITNLPNHVEIVADGEQIRTACLIGADGANYLVRRMAGFDFRVVRYPAIEADVFVDRPEDFEMEFDFSLSPPGYFWIFPRDDHVNIGIYSPREGKGVKAKLLQDFSAVRFPGKTISSIKGYPIGTGGYCRQPGKGRVLLVGDAAGLAEPCFGEGIYFALKSGQTAARAAVNSGPESPERLYTQYMKVIRKELFLYSLGAAFLYRSPDLFLNGLSLPFIRDRFARGYCLGKSLTEILAGH